MKDNISTKLKRSAGWLYLKKTILNKYARQNFESIENAAQFLRASELFDAERYARATSCRRMGFEPAFHYILSGELDGYVTEQFDPKFYARRYPDVGSSRTNRLLHYVTVGRAEGRFPTRAHCDRAVPQLPPDPIRPTILVVCHDASRTGAPIVGWNIMRNLKNRYRVIALIFGTGDLVEAFERDADLVVSEVPKLNVDREQLLGDLLRLNRPLFAIINSVESRFACPELVACGVPFVTLAHEFACYYGKPGKRLLELFQTSQAVIFPAELVKASSIELYPSIDHRRFFVQPQGQSSIPPLSQGEKDRASKCSSTGNIREILRPHNSSRQFIVAGLGTIDFRKGTDLFIALATSLIHSRPELDLLFVWIGHRFKTPENAFFSLHLDEQIQRSALKHRLLMIEPIADLDAVYDEIDVLFLSSRLDPLPNVSIDAAFAGKPVVCFDKGSGFAELLQQREEIRKLVVPYLDIAAAGRLISEIAEDKQMATALGQSIAKFANETFDMSTYVQFVEAQALEAVNRQSSSIA